MNKEENNLENSIKDAYIDVSDSAVPDMWDRIQAGYKQELEKLKKEAESEETTEKIKPVGKLQYDFEKYMSRKDYDRICDHIKSTDNVVSFDEAKKKRSFNKKWIGFIAASVLILVLAIPILNSSMSRNKKSEDFTTAAFVNEQIKSDDMACEAADDTEASGEAEVTQENMHGLDSAGADMETEGMTNQITTEAASEINSDEAFSTCVSGEVSRIDGLCVMEVMAVDDKAAIGTADIDIKPGDTICLLENSKKLDMAEGEKAMYEDMVIARCEKGAGAYKEYTFVAEVLETGIKK